MGIANVECAQVSSQGSILLRLWVASTAPLGLADMWVGTLCGHVRRSVLSCDSFGRYGSAGFCISLEQNPQAQLVVRRNFPYAGQGGLVEEFSAEALTPMLQKRDVDAILVDDGVLIKRTRAGT